MDNETATGQSAQDITSRIESALFADDTTETIEDTIDVADEDEVILPGSDDTDNDDDDDSGDLEEIATEEDLSLAGYLGVDDDRITVGDDGAVKFTAIVDGEKKEVPLSELATSYQLQGHVNNKSIALEDERKTFETEKQTVTETLTQRLEQVNNMTKMVEEQLLGEFNSIDWNRLRTENPAEWTALRQEFADKAQRVQQMQSQVSTQQQQLTQEQQTQLEAQQKVHMQEQLSKVLAANPTWSDQAVMKADTDALKSFLSESYGFGADDFAMVTDHRIISLIQDANAYRSGKKAAEVKIAKTVPKFQKPGAVKANAQKTAKARRVKASKSRLKETGSIRDAAALLLDRM